MSAYLQQQLKGRQWDSRSVGSIWGLPSTPDKLFAKRTPRPTDLLTGTVRTARVGDYLPSADFWSAALHPRQDAAHKRTLPDIFAQSEFKGGLESFGTSN